MSKNNDKTEETPSKVSLPREMEREFWKLMKEDETLKFESYREFVKDSVRNNILKYREEILKYREISKNRE